MKRRLIVIGNGMAGIRTVEELLALAPDRYAITVISSEPVVAYNRIMLSPVLAGEKRFEDIVTHPESWYAEHGVTLLAGFTVTDVRRKQREVVLADGQVLPYDRLVLATGSTPFIIPLPGHQHPDVLSFRDIHDVERMVRAAAHKKRVAVIGGGLLGLEAANGLLKQGMEVTVIHDMPHLLNRQLDPEASTMLRDTLEARGMHFRLGVISAQIVHGATGEHLERIEFKDGSELPVDLVVMAVGIRPNVALAKKIGLQVDKAILVNDTLQTFDPCIYAVGECVQHRGALFGLVAPLFEQARVCANHLAEQGVSRFVQRATATTLKVSGVNLYSAGDFTDADAETLVLRDPAGGVYKRLLIKNDRVIGSVLYGDTNDGVWYFDLIREQRNVASMRESLLFGKSEHEEATPG
ncbi:MAG: NAD(P)/FAD-dependent oxidoreductase [Moraxellaceae bacterium]|jgi:nitrite reductase (NADH) large subunit|nr:NAD(P)/FAD-dependent oxidoreductase [Moraxellaceae bacterium]